MASKAVGGCGRLLNDRLISHAAALISSADHTRGRKCTTIASIDRLSVRTQLRLQRLQYLLILALRFCAARLDLSDDVIGARPFGKIGFVQFTTLDVYEPAAGIARMAIRQINQFRTVRHCRLVEFEYVGARGNTVNAVLALAVGNDIGSIFHV